MSEKRNGFFAGLGVLLVLFTALPAPSAAQDADQRIKKLEQTIARLEQRIAKLEVIILEMQKGQSSQRNASFERWKEKASWRSLKKGMSKKEVEQILGDPPKTIPNAYYGDIWLYPDLQGGNASFDKDGILTSWKEF